MKWIFIYFVSIYLQLTLTSDTLLELDRSIEVEDDEKACSSFSVLVLIQFLTF
jgi:hypothetical protein